MRLNHLLTPYVVAVNQLIYQKPQKAGDMCLISSFHAQKRGRGAVPEVWFSCLIGWLAPICRAHVFRRLALFSGHLGDAATHR